MKTIVNVGFYSLIAFALFGAIAGVVAQYRMAQGSTDLSRLRASVVASGHDARKLIEQDKAGAIQLTDSARYRLKQIEARSK